MIKYFTIPLIERKFLLVTSPSNIEKAVIKHKMGKTLLNDVKKSPPEKGDKACCWSDLSNGRTVMWFASKDLGTVVHEIEHAVFNIFKSIGATREEEFRAYTKEWLFNEIRSILRE